VFIPVFVMARPRGGSFVYDASEIEATRGDIERVIAAGADGVVVGALTPANEIDLPAVRGFIALAAGAPITFHRAFDQVADPAHALETLIDAGVQRVLTAGGQGTALEGSSVLEALVRQAGDRIVVMAGGKVRGHNARDLIARTGVRELHARCESNASQIAELVDVARSEV
jgi:copper homeostasis protein